MSQKIKVSVRRVWRGDPKSPPTGLSYEVRTSTGALTHRADFTLEQLDEFAETLNFFLSNDV